MIEVEAPDGTIIEFPAGTSNDVIKGVMQKNFGGPQETSLGHKVGATIDGIAQGMTFGFSDEIAAGLGTGFGYLGNYDKALAEERARMEENRERAGGYELAGQIAGGLTTAGGLAKSGATLLGRGLGTKAAVAEGAAYGGLYGAGNAEEGNRATGALTGAATGAVTAGVLDKAGRAVSKRIAQAKNKVPLAPGVQSLIEDANKLYKKSEAAGVRIKDKAMQRLGKNVMMAAGRQNDKLRPKAAGIVEDFADMMKRNVSLEEFDEFRQVVSMEMKGANESDKRALMAIKNQLDNFTENPKAKDFSGDRKGFKYLEEGREIWKRKKKLEIIEQALDFADIDSGQYSQSGIANTVQRQFKALYKKIQKDPKLMKSFTQEEIQAIRELGAGQSSGAAQRFLAKFAPRGVVSTMLGMAPSMATGPAALALPLAGHFAAKGADKAAVRGAQAVRDNVARGFAPPPLQIQNYHRPLIPIAGQQSGILAPEL